MVCDSCGQGEAVIHLTQIVNNEMTTSHLCEQCAAAKGLETAAEGPPNFPLTDFLAQMGDAPEQDASSEATCGFCGLTFAGFRENRADGVSPLLCEFREPPARASPPYPRRHATRGEGVPPHGPHRVRASQAPGWAQAPTPAGGGFRGLRAGSGNPRLDPDPRAQLTEAGRAGERGAR